MFSAAKFSLNNESNAYKVKSLSFVMFPLILSLCHVEVVKLPSSENGFPFIFILPYMYI